MVLLKLFVVAVALQGVPQDTVVQQTQPLADSLFVEHVEWFDKEFGSGVRLRERYGYYFRNLRPARPDTSMYELFERTRACARNKSVTYEQEEEFEEALFANMSWYLFDFGWILDYDLNNGDQISGVVMAGRHILIMRGFEGRPGTVVHEIFHVFFPGLWHSEIFYTMLNECIPEVW